MDFAKRAFLKGGALLGAGLAAVGVGEIFEGELLGGGREEAAGGQEGEQEGFHGEATTLGESTRGLKPLLRASAPELDPLPVIA